MKTIFTALLYVSDPLNSVLYLNGIEILRVQNGNGVIRKFSANGELHEATIHHIPNLDTDRRQNCYKPMTVTIGEIFIQFCKYSNNGAYPYSKLFIEEKGNLFHAYLNGLEVPLDWNSIETVSEEFCENYLKLAIAMDIHEAEKEKVHNLPK